VETDDGALVYSAKNESTKSNPDGYSLRQFTDGASNTFFVGESAYFSWISAADGFLGPVVDSTPNNAFNANFPNWMGSGEVEETNIAETNCSSLLNIRTDDDTFYSEHPGIVQFVYSDGSVHTVSENIDIGALVLLGTRNDGLTQASIDCATTVEGALGGG